MPALRLLAAGQSGSGSTPSGSLHAVLAGVLDRAEHLGGVQQRLGRDAAAVQAGAADLVLLHHRDRQPGRRGVEGRRVSAGAAAEDDEVVVAHARATFRSVSAIWAGCGTTASSSGGLVGVGVFFAAIRTTGWSRCQKASSWMVAAISAP